MKIDISVALSKALRNAPNPASFARGALTAAVVGCAELVRENFAKLDMERNRHGSHFYEQKGVDATSYRIDGDTGAVVVNSHEMAHKLRGGIVVPVRVKYLAIPLADKYFVKPPRAYGVVKGSPLQFVRGRGGNAVLVDKRSGEAAYALVRRVNHKPHPETLPDESALSARADEAVKDFAEAELGGV